MANIAALILSAKAPLVVEEVEKYTPGPNEILVKNEAIALNPVEWKIAKLAIFPLQYPAILGSSFGGTVEAVGSQVTRFKVGDKVAASKSSGAVDPKYGAYQKFVVVGEETVTKVPNGLDISIPAGLTGNLPTVLGLFTGRLGLEKPSFDNSISPKSDKILIYGGSSNLGGLSIQYVAQAGYQVITTSSPRNKDVVSKLGPAKVIDHTQEKEALLKALIAEGPYHAVIDTISFPDTVALNAEVLAAQGGGTVFTLQPPFGPETLPEGVTREMNSWNTYTQQPENAGLLGWGFSTYLERGLANGKIHPLPVEKFNGGLKGLNGALDALSKGVSGVKLIVDPWE